MKTYLILIAVFMLGCSKTFEAPVPDMSWDLYESPLAVKVGNLTRQRLEGVYSISGTDAFGTLAAMKWSSTFDGADTLYHLSIFCEVQTAYFILEGKKKDNDILLNGYWRRLVNTETGRVRLTVNTVNGSRYLTDPTAPFPDSLVIEGLTGRGEEVPDQMIKFKYLRQLNSSAPFEIVAHRGGGRTADLLPASENSVEIIRLASRFGATGVEIDVQLTKDGVPILFHDATLNERVVKNSGLYGPVSNYTWAQLSTLVRLPKGEKIPTLREALNTIVYNTSLRFVWLDTKFQGPLQQLRDLQAEFQQKAQAAGRTVEIFIGIPDDDVLKNFQSLPGYQSIPSIVELSPDKVREVNARVWGPQWTLGLQNDEVDKMHAQGRRVITWTLDGAENIKQYMGEGRFDGILSNNPSLVAFYYYVR